MCANPTTANGVTFACTRCNDCIAARINGWVARAMAEKAESKFCYLLALTYGSDTQEKTDGAAVFRYKDIKDLLKRIRRQAEYRFGKSATLRYIVAGELGSMKKRVHWHVVFFSSFDLLSIGDWSSFVSKKPIANKEQKITTNPNDAKRLLWSAWPLGLIVVQEPDEGGMMYALKYALKDQFSMVKSEGTMREAKSEAYASGFFRMSKYPPIGSGFVAAKLQRLADLGAVLPSLKIKVPNYRGYLYPAGYLLKQVVAGFKAINAAAIEQRGQNVPQWPSLIGSVQKQPKIWMELQDDQEEEQPDDFERHIKSKSREYADAQFLRAIRARCGGLQPCAACLNGFSDVRFDEAKSYAIGSAAGLSVKAADRKHRRSRICNPYCQNLEAVVNKRAFSTLT